MSFNERLKTYRKARGWSQAHMAEVLGIHLNTVKKYEISYTHPTMEILKKIAVALNITTDELVFDKNERTPKNNLSLKFEALSQLPIDDQNTIANLIDSLVIKHQTVTLARKLENNKER